MKKINFIKGLLALAISLTLVQCTSDDPIPGPAGANGTNGINGAPGTPGTPGIDGGNVCLSCHNVDFKVVQPATYAISGHAIGTKVLVSGVEKELHETRSGACNACHNEQGYIESIKRNYDISSFSGWVKPAESEMKKISCTTCHSGGHAAAALAISGKDAALRSADAYKLNQKTAAGADIIMDYKNNSNACIHCHQSRRNDVTGLTPNATTFMISLASSTGPHYGNQVSMLEGMFAAEIPGTTVYPTKGTAVHRTGASCTQCHMGAAKDGKGNHSMKPKLDLCKTCHTGAGVVDYNINGGQTKIKNLRLELAEELIRVRPAIFKIANYTGSKTFAPANVYVDATASDNFLTVIATTNVDSRIPADVTVAKGYWNWKYIYQDHSYGLHNPKYADAVLKNTIAALKLLP
jgi:formate-dependent nitrite reductase cytochrome c552 subunit